MTSSKKIVIAEDEANLLLLLKIILTEAGFTVFCAKDGVEAFEFCKSEQPDLLITDYMMPRKNGLELCRDLKAESQLSKIPVIMCSALTDQGLQKDSRDLGVLQYLSKPFSAAVLKEAVVKVLG